MSPSEMKLQQKVIEKFKKLAPTYYRVHAESKALGMMVHQLTCKRVLLGGNSTEATLKKLDAALDRIAKIQKFQEKLKKELAK